MAGEQLCRRVFLGICLVHVTAASSPVAQDALVNNTTLNITGPDMHVPANDDGLSEWLALSSETMLFERALLPSPAKMVTLNGWNMVGTEAACDRYTLLNETQCWQKCEQSAKCELVTFGVNKKAGFCCLHQVNQQTLLAKPVQSRNWKVIYEEQPVLHRVEGQVFWGDKIRRFDVDQEEVCSLACVFDPNCNVAAFKKTKNVCFLMKNMEVPRNVWDPEYITFYTELQLKL